MTAAVTNAGLTRSDVEDFLYHEAALLDDWRLEEWLDLFTLDCLYEVPASDRPQCAPEDSFSLIHDRRPMLEQRVIRLSKPTAHAEFPHSRTRRMISNVRVLNAGPQEAEAVANFTIFRSRNGTEVFYVGSYRYGLTLSGGQMKIRYRCAVLDHEVLDPHGKISIIL
ncbi:hypothetical protein MSAS_43620 [Mycobacterium saskatchewanense]|uniref:p-cumate dioxygenase n=1 Tax=Mycobacterium saskatchewanense TaxID=220927 RepID=A0AAJ3NSW3_9MYCO|nr:aromatic-ring-hydroxylating dioxygenase subunit beta [Mycobacterium saskatchewanense]ORW73724.1 p-cumate dioxygenase [Mycobacterium saskatchewanense]BBX65188.1 hypothetical protein MSAS_43620 [Mycobacterium saskatchewanense]